MIDVNRKGEVWVFAEQHGGNLEDTPIELMSKARHLADTLGVKLAAALLGDNVKALGTKLIQHGADKVYLAEHPQLLVFNKIDRLKPELLEQRTRPHGGIGISALEPDSTRVLLEAIERRLWETRV